MVYVRTDLSIRGQLIEIKDISRPWGQGDQEKWNKPIGNTILEESVFLARFEVIKEFIETGLLIIPQLYTGKGLFFASTTATLTGWANIGTKDTILSYDYWKYGEEETVWNEPSDSNPHTPEDPPEWEEMFVGLTGLTPDTLYNMRIKAVNELGTFYGNTSSFSTTA